MGVKALGWVTPSLVRTLGASKPLHPVCSITIRGCSPWSCSSLRLCCIRKRLPPKRCIRCVGLGRITDCGGGLVCRCVCAVRFADLSNAARGGEMDDTGSTRIGKFVFNHPFPITGRNRYFALSLSRVYLGGCCAVNGTHHEKQRRLNLRCFWS